VRGCSTRYQVWDLTPLASPFRTQGICESTLVGEHWANTRPVAPDFQVVFKRSKQKKDPNERGTRGVSLLSFIIPAVATRRRPSVFDGMNETMLPVTMLIVFVLLLTIMTAVIAEEEVESDSQQEKSCQIFALLPFINRYAN